MTIFLLDPSPPSFSIFPLSSSLYKEEYRGERGSKRESRYTGDLPWKIQVYRLFGWQPSWSFVTPSVRLYYDLDPPLGSVYPRDSQSGETSSCKQLLLFQAMRRGTPPELWNQVLDSVTTPCYWLEMEYLLHAGPCLGELQAMWGLDPPTTSYALRSALLQDHVHGSLR